LLLRRSALSGDPAYAGRFSSAAVRRHPCTPSDDSEERAEGAGMTGQRITAIGRTGRRTRGPLGFSLVELLVTIFVFGLAMAALFPVFVLATKTNSGDAARNIALNIAQDRIEKIRQLDYDDITVPNLEDSSFFGGQFGKTYDYRRNGSSKIYYIEYQVKDVEAGATGSSTIYKQVKVRVTWQGNPAPVKPVELKTVIYRQYSGPQIRTVGLDPATVAADARLLAPPFPPDVRGQFENERWIDSDGAAANRETVNVYLNANDVPSMTGVDDDGNVIKGWVSLTITAPGGIPVVSEQKLTEPVSTSTGTFYTYPWDWRAANAPDAMCTITATAYSYKKAKGNTVQVRVRLETGAPATPTGLYVAGSQAADGGGQAVLTWDDSADLDIMYYKVVRFDDSENVGGLEVAGDIGDESTWLKENAFTDQGIASGDTSVYYEVYAVDEAYNVSLAATCPVDWTSSGPAPLPPTDLTATVDGGLVNLSWTQPSDASIISGYQVYKYVDGVPTVVKTVSSLNCSWDQGFSSTGLYQVRSVNMQGTNFSVWATVLPGAGQGTQLVDGAPWLAVSTGIQPLYTISVQSNVNLKTNEQLTARLYAGRGGSGAGLTRLAEWVGLVQGVPSSASVLNQPSGWYSIEWQVINTKSGKVVQAWIFKDYSVPLQSGSNQTLQFP
jgi:prepilin-type N-terminal cleavage/methylation domain-containing protein